MEIPEDVLGIIREFTKPICRLDWRNGSYLSRNMITPESNFRSEILMKVQDWRERNLEHGEYLISLNQLYDTYDIWKNTYHFYFYPDIVGLMEY